ncbi:MAG: D-alanyl-D-alanine carboxypeptidase family protein [Hyphomonadaceae bacterium]
MFNAETGRVLHVLNPDQEVYPASLTKMMTLYLAFRVVQAGWAQLDDRVMISETAAQAPPTKLGLRAGDQPTVDDLIRGCVTRSANDAARALGEEIDRRFGPALVALLRADLAAAEADETADSFFDPPSQAEAADWAQSVAAMRQLADSIISDGSETDFARIMTLQARLLGMDNTTFRNASGLPDPEQITTAPDLALLAYAIVKLPPGFYQYFSLQHFLYGGASHRNHNLRFLTTYNGADGIKTGYTQDSGFNVADSARRGDTRLIAIVMGGRSVADREANVQVLLNAGFEQDPILAFSDTPASEGLAAGSMLDLPRLRHAPVITAAAISPSAQAGGRGMTAMRQQGE